MKNNKGFTLTELIAIIVLISVFSLIAGPNLTKQIKTSDEEEKNVLSQNIYNASLIYMGKYFAEDIVSGNYGAVSFTLNDLIEDGLFNLDDKCSGDVNKEITFDKEEYEPDFSKIGCYSK